MSYNEDVRGQKARSTQKSGKKASTFKARFLAYHPTKQEKEALKSLPWTDSALIDRIIFQAAKGHKFSLRQNAETDNYAAMVSETGQGYPRDMTVSAFHSDARKAVQSILYALETRFSDFPDLEIAAEFVDEW